MNESEYEELYRLESFYWWFVARRKLVHDIVRDCECPKDAMLLDVGCGTGLNYSMLSQFGSVWGTDRSSHALEFSRRRGINTLNQSDAEDLQFSDNTFDLSTALDVLEHVDDDLRGISEIFRVLKPGGWLVVTVPAYGFLWSEHDEALHHRRRYTAHELRNKITNAGFNVERSTYFITTLFFPIFLIRFAKNLTRKSVRAKTSHVILPKWANSLLIKILDLERLYLRFSNLPFGVSIVCIARKPRCSGDGERS
jgi:ubiquinone/menaquinone biosynthesis C-methylase UbiE